MGSQTVAVIGFGRTGKAVLDFFLRRNSTKTICLYNDNPIEGKENIKVRKKYEKAGVKFLVGEERFQELNDADLIILSPGVNGRTPRFNRLRKKGVRIVSEIELAFAFIQGRVIAVTGTNGKSTTASLIHHILKNAGVDSFLTGNIGQPLIAEVDKISAASMVVVEVSSFQLEEIMQFRPDIALILNVTPDHLDRYIGVDDYFAAKLNLVKNQVSSDLLVLNGDDALLRQAELQERYGTSQLIWFSRDCGSDDAAACLTGNHLCLKMGHRETDTVELISLENNPLRGVHNLENILAAATASRLAGVEPHQIEEAITSFKGLEHRMELAGRIAGGSAGRSGDVEFINDSKATNVDATLKSVTSIDQPMVVILGGKDKGGDFTILEDPLRQKAHRILLVGDAAATIREQLHRLEDLFLRVTDLKQAVATGLDLLMEKGGVVLLAPGCASFDMFDSFEHRGRVFKEEVQMLEQELKNREDT